MKTLKKVLAVLLAAAVVVMGGATAFASSDNQTLDWDTMYEDFTADYVGEITAKNFAISEQGDGNEFVYYTFDADESGYYMVTYDWYPVDDCIIAETLTNGKVTESKESEVISSNDIVTEVFYLEDGINYICFDRYFDGEDSYASIEFLGAEIEDIIIDEDTLQDLLVDVDILEYEYEEGFVWWTDTVIKFSSGKTISSEDMELVFDMNNPVAEGEISLTLNYLDFSKDFTATAVEFESIFADAEIVEIDDCTTVEEYYDGSINTNKVEGATLKVTFTDGTTATGTVYDSYASITFPNGRDYYFAVYYSFEDDGNYYCNIAFETAEDIIECKSYVCETVDADCAGNGDILNENITYPFDYASYNFLMNLLNLDYTSTIGEVIYVLSATFGEMAIDYEYAFTNLFMQLTNYLVRVIFG